MVSAEIDGLTFITADRIIPHIYLEPNLFNHLIKTSLWPFFVIFDKFILQSGLTDHGLCEKLRTANRTQTSSVDVNAAGKLWFLSSRLLEAPDHVFSDCNA